MKIVDLKRNDCARIGNQTVNVAIPDVAMREAETASTHTRPVRRRTK